MKKTERWRVEGNFMFILYSYIINVEQINLKLERKNKENRVSIKAENEYSSDIVTLLG